MPPKKDRELEDMKVWELERLYYLAKLKEMKESIPKDRLYDDDIFSDSSERVKINRRIQPVTIVDPSSPDIPQVFDGDRIRTFQRTERLVEVPGVAAGATITVTAGEEWLVLSMFGSFDADANAANRVLGMDTRKYCSSQFPYVMNITGPTITANQVGAMYLTAGFAPNWMQNTNNTLAVVADENPLPLYVKGADTMNFSYTNPQVGDQSEFEIYYVRLDEQ